MGEESLQRGEGTQRNTGRFFPGEILGLDGEFVRAGKREEACIARACSRRAGVHFCARLEG